MLGRATGGPTHGWEGRSALRTWIVHASWGDPRAGLLTGCGLWWTGPAVVTRSGRQAWTFLLSSPTDRERSSRWSR
jgi:hypothetical protein